MTTRTNPQFPPDFVWGAATAAYQVEGAVQTDGRGESIWDRFSHTPGKVANGDTGDIACDHYHLWPEDVALMRDLGLDAYRFSIAWPRIMPTGRGAVNPAGLDFYDRLVDALLAQGLAPYATLYHWDLPQALQDEGGWANRATAHAFAEYADVVARRLGDRIAAWATHNEPWCIAILSNLLGEHAPGLHDLATAATVAHHVLLAHGLAVPVLRAATPGVPVGIVLNPSLVHPASPSPADQEAARLEDALNNRLFLDPLFYARYPPEAAAMMERLHVPIEEGDLQIIAAPLDWLGVNYYTRNVVRHAPDRPEYPVEPVPQGDAAHTEMGWEVYPDGLRELLERLHRDYPVPAYYVTENGAAYPDVLEPDGTVHDPQRQAYLAAHLAAVAQARAAGVPVKGYFAWSLMDNFEWAFGYTRRFGLVYVDYATQRRTWKDSAHWYRDFIAAQRPLPV